MFKQKGWLVGWSVGWLAGLFSNEEEESLRLMKEEGKEGTEVQPLRGGRVRGCDLARGWSGWRLVDAGILLPLE